MIAKPWHRYLFIGVLISLVAGLASAVYVVFWDEPQPDFFLELDVTRSEQSLDSNTQTEAVIITGRHVRYYWSYDGYIPDDNAETTIDETFTLTSAEFTQLITILEEQQLLVPVVEEVQAVDQSIDPVLLDAVLNITWQGSQTHSHVQNDAMYTERARTVIAFIRNTGDI